MPISMWVRRELAAPGERLAEGSIAWGVSAEALSAQDTPLLMWVDPYGLTVFNRLQVRHQLPAEVSFLRGSLTDPASVAMLDELERLMAVATARVHRYLWFIGD